MMLGEPHHHNHQHHHRSINPTIDVPPWPLLDDPPTDETPLPSPYSSYSPHSNSDHSATASGSPNHLSDFISALRRFLPSNLPDSDPDHLDLSPPREVDSPVDVFSCDHFRMYEFKVRRCARGRSHDWTECPYAHPGEKARRRDPRKYHYSGTACPDFRKGNCRKGDACEFAHGVFECWLHPSRYRTQPCKDGAACRRRVCFFAHSPDQLRPVVAAAHQSPRGGDSSEKAGLPFLLSPNSVSPEESPPVSPMAVTQSLSRSLGSSCPANEMVLAASLRNLQLGKVKSLPSPRNAQMPFGSPLRPGFCSVPTTPTRVPVRPGVGYLDFWDRVGEEVEEEPVMERVESGRDLRLKMFEKLSKECSLERTEPGQSSGGAPDVDWVSDLLE